jgi:hypothetical protein
MKNAATAESIVAMIEFMVNAYIEKCNPPPPHPQGVEAGVLADVVKSLLVGTLQQIPEKDRRVAFADIVRDTRIEVFGKGEA